VPDLHHQETLGDDHSAPRQTDQDDIMRRDQLPVIVF
jgi:hypothetical protein